jgi:hypothetical protein
VLLRPEIRGLIQSVIASRIPISPTTQESGGNASTSLALAAANQLSVRNVVSDPGGVRATGTAFPNPAIVLPGFLNASFLAKNALRDQVEL